MVSYMGIFFEGDNELKILKAELSSGGITLEKIPDNLHCTFQYQPTDEQITDFNKIVGKEFEIKLIGYGNNQKNAGFLIEIPDELNRYFTNGQNEGRVVPKHITTSFTKKSPAVFTRDLDFKPLDKPITVKGKAGFYVKENDMKGISYNKQNVIENENN